MPNKSISSFNDLTINTNDFRMLHFNFWGDSEINFYHKHRSTIGTQLIIEPKYYRKRKFPQQVTPVKWTLNDQNSEICQAWFELQKFPNYFEKALLFYGTSETADEKMVSEGLAALISAIFLVGETDFLWLPSLEGHSNLTANWGEGKTIHTLMVEWLPKDEPFVPVPVIEINPIDWWKTNLGLKYKKELNYLKLRVIRQKASQERKQDRKKKGRFSSPFRRAKILE